MWVANWSPVHTRAVASQMWCCAGWGKWGSTRNRATGKLRRGRKRLYACAASARDGFGLRSVSDRKAGVRWIPSLQVQHAIPCLTISVIGMDAVLALRKISQVKHLMVGIAAQGHDVLPV
jgi:hypothetical protein